MPLFFWGGTGRVILQRCGAEIRVQGYGVQRWGEEVRGGDTVAGMGSRDTGAFGGNVFKIRRFLRMRQILRSYIDIMKKIVWVVLLSFLSVAVLFSFRFGKEEAVQSEKNIILRIWNVDSFEGGTGSRTAFLSAVAKKYSKKNKNIYFLVSSMTAQSAKAAIESGNIPDILSYGIGMEFSPQICAVLQKSFAGGLIDGVPYAYPWCRGGYLLFSKKNDFSNVQEANTVISCGGQNLPTVALAAEGYFGTFPEKTSTSAYVDFLNGKYEYMLGTQRDLFRFASRGEAVYSRSLNAYNDLYQYIGILSKENISVCLDYIAFLLSGDVQKSLTSLGLCGIEYKGTFSNEALEELYEAQPKYTCNVFNSESCRSDLATLSRECMALHENFEKKAESFLQPIEKER